MVVRTSTAHKTVLKVDGDLVPSVGDEGLLIDLPVDFKWPAGKRGLGLAQDLLDRVGCCGGEELHGCWRRKQKLVESKFL